jgi:hypothetical protein
MVIFSVFLAYSMRKKLMKYILVFWCSRMAGLLAYSLIHTIRMLVFGALHSLLRNHPAQLPVMLGLEGFFVVCLVLSMKRWRAHNVLYSLWWLVCFGLLRMVFQMVLIFQQNAGVVGTATA